MVELTWIDLTGLDGLDCWFLFSLQSSLEWSFVAVLVLGWIAFYRLKYSNQMEDVD
jgi:hypothetical protein